MSFALKTAAFPSEGEIPQKYTCSGADVSPALAWSGIPKEAHSLALIVDDPDAPGGVWTHWLIWNIPAQASELPEAVPHAEVLENGAHQGLNDFKRIGYGGPCPPPGKAHRYFFKLHALDTELSNLSHPTKAQLEQAMQGHVLAKAQLMGTYEKQKK